MRLHKKMGRAAPYLRALVERMVEWPSLGARELWGGYLLTAVDGDSEGASPVTKRRYASGKSLGWSTFVPLEASP